MSGRGRRDGDGSAGGRLVRSGCWLGAGWAGGVVEGRVEGHMEGWCLG